ncbi:hypothetical protein CQA40_05365 [Helicobacter sp. MIT 01-3238]|nr:hypothetical protein CQA40_05365 [Helicobacter sp. MIT 01-3238]
MRVWRLFIFKLALVWLFASAKNFFTIFLLLFLFFSHFKILLFCRFCATLWEYILLKILNLLPKRIFL